MADGPGTDANPQYSGQYYWDEYHGTAQRGDIKGEIKRQTWLDCFAPLLRSTRVRSVLDLGCGSGRDTLALAAAGYQVAGCDISPVAIARAGALAAEQELSVDFRPHDIAHSLPYRHGQFDAVVCNLTLHMFAAPIARRIVAEVRRCLVPGGLFLFHVNSVEDLPYRRALQPPVVPLGHGMYSLGRGQTMRFYSESDCRELLADWQLLTLEPVRMLRPDGAVQKCAWRCAARIA